MTDRVVFNLKRWWPPGEIREFQVDLYEQIKEGIKKSEIRDASEFWASRLLTEKGPRVRGALTTTLEPSFR